MNELLHQELLAMREEDLAGREELIASEELGGSYVPRMGAVHQKNAARLGECVEPHGWAIEDIAAKDGREAAWLIAQHAIGEPKVQRQALRLLHACVAEARVPARHAAYLQDRIAMYEGRPQRYGTQLLDDPRYGQIRLGALAEPERVNGLRADVGLEPLRPSPELGPELSAEEREGIEQNYLWQ